MPQLALKQNASGGLQAPFEEEGDVQAASPPPQ